MAELLRNKEAMEKLQDELRSRSVSTNSDMITEEDLQGMVYLKTVMKETMRLHPPGPLLITREAMEQTRIQQYDVPSKTMVIVNAWAIGRDPEVWAAPEVFMPERFLDTAKPAPMMPFGLGRRRCPAEGLAMRLLGLTLATLVQCFEWDAGEGRAIDMAEGAGLSMPMATPLAVVCRPREFVKDFLSAST